MYQKIETIFDRIELYSHEGTGDLRILSCLLLNVEIHQSVSNVRGISCKNGRYIFKIPNWPEDDARSNKMLDLMGRWYLNGGIFIYNSCISSFPNLDKNIVISCIDHSFIKKDTIFIGYDNKYKKPVSKLAEEAVYQIDKRVNFFKQNLDKYAISTYEDYRKFVKEWNIDKTNLPPDKEMEKLLQVFNEKIDNFKMSITDILINDHYLMLMMGGIQNKSSSSNNKNEEIPTAGSIIASQLEDTSMDIDSDGTVLEDVIRKQVERNIEELQNTANSGSESYDIEKLLNVGGKKRHNIFRQLRNAFGNDRTLHPRGIFSKKNMLRDSNSKNFRRDYYGDREINVMVDVSGSISDKTLEEMYSYIKSLTNEFKLRLVQWDNETKGRIELINHVGHSFFRKGQGGTDVLPTLNQLKELGLMKKATTLIMTDGELFQYDGLSKYCKDDIIWLIFQRTKGEIKEGSLPGKVRYIYESG